MQTRASNLFAEWTDEIGVCFAAELLGVDPGHVSRLRSGKKVPSLRLAARIQRATKTWRKPILAVSWVPVCGPKPDRDAAPAEEHAAA